MVLQKNQLKQSMLTRNLFSKCAIAALLISFCSCNGDKTGFVDVFKLVSAFELQKEYSSQARAGLELVRTGIDSVISVQRLQDTIKANLLKEELYNSLSKDVETQNKEIEKMIWTRLNPYIVEYGKDKGYDYIYGANGTGNVLYADTKKDITDDLIKYVNEKYHDK